MVASAQMLLSMVLLAAAAAGPAADASPRASEDAERGAPPAAAAVAAAAAGDHSIELVGDSQSFFPSFANLFEPRQSFRSFGQPEAAYSQRPGSYKSLLNYPLFGSYRAEPYSRAPAAAAAAAGGPDGALGSGNFGVLRGGTFHADEDGSAEYEDFGYFGAGRGRNPRPDYQQEPFANFRDFADINAPASAAYSHAVVVYARPGAGPEPAAAPEPNNIFEALQRLDAAEAPAPKVSKAKAKLARAALALRSKKDQWKKAKTRGEEEPLLALS